MFRKSSAFWQHQIQEFQVFACVRAVFLYVIMNASSTAAENAGRSLKGDAFEVDDLVAFAAGEG